MTSKQFYIMLSVFWISLKLQRLPSLVYDATGKNSYIVFLIYFMVDFLFVLGALFILSVLKKHNFLKEQKNKVIAFITKIGLLFVSIYFILQGTLFYETIQDLFSNILFNYLPWTLFSLLLIVCVFYLASSGIYNIARNFELYFVVIIISYIILAIFGGLRTDFLNILPIEDFYIKTTAKHFFDFNIWFGDFFVVLFLGINTKDIKIKWTVLSYLLSAFYVLLMVIEFNGIYLSYTGQQSSLMSMISEQSMLGIDIGRVDWFLILLSEIGTILSCGVCLCFAKNCLSLVVPKIKSNYLLAGIMIVLYCMDVFYLVDVNAKQQLFYNFAGILALVVKFTSFFAMFFICICIKIKQKKLSKVKPKLKEADTND